MVLLSKETPRTLLSQICLSVRRKRRRRQPGLFFRPSAAKDCEPILCVLRGDFWGVCVCVFGEMLSIALGGRAVCFDADAAARAGGGDGGRANSVASQALPPLQSWSHFRTVEQFAQAEGSQRGGACVKSLGVNRRCVACDLIHRTLAADAGDILLTLRRVQWTPTTI